jgi:uncharacterized RDD family membrane protein YckC
VNALPQFPAQASGPRLDNRRIAAGVVDLAVVGLVAVVLRAVAGGEFTTGLAAVTVAWGLFYYFVSESTWSQTLGKRLLGLRVERSGGGAPDERAVALRTVVRVVDGIAFYLVGLLVMLRTGERRQRLGDIVAGTVVVDARAAAKPTVKSTLKARDVPVPEPEEAVADEPHRAGAPTSSFEPIAEPAKASEPVADEDESPRIEIVSEPAEEPVVEEPEVEEPVAEEPEVEEPVAAEPEVEEPVAEEPVAEEPEVEEPEDAGELARASSPAIEELAGDVASSASASKPSRRRQRPRPSGKELPREEKPADEDITVKPVETVSPMDLVMTESEPQPEKAGKGRGGAA